MKAASNAVGFLLALWLLIWLVRGKEPDNHGRIGRDQDDERNKHG